MKQIVRNFFLTSAAVAAIALTANSAMAESKVNVPFSFQVAGKTLPAGRYTIVPDSTNNFVTLKSDAAGTGLTWLLRPGSANPSDRSVVLRFDSTDQDHALRSIQYGPRTTPRLDNGKDRREHTHVDAVSGQ